MPDHASYRDRRGDDILRFVRDAAQNVLPEWNALPDALRGELVRIGEDACCRCCAEAVGGDLALEVYTKLREALPPARFPLFEYREAIEHEAKA